MIGESTSAFRRAYHAASRAVSSGAKTRTSEGEIRWNCIKREFMNYQSDALKNLRAAKITSVDNNLKSLLTLHQTDLQRDSQYRNKTAHNSQA